jgi:hypothetical protein
MSATAATQLDAIHSMLTAGSRSVRVERHSLLVWGLAGALLCIGVDFIITHERFPERAARAAMALGLIGGVLLAAGLLDFRLTRRLREARDETLSFVQRQIYKSWWLLLAMGVLLNYGMVFFGGGYMTFSMWMVLVGMGLFFHGLFSRQAVEWGGVLMIGTAVAALALRLPHEFMRWLAAAAFGIGVPLMGVLFDADAPGAVSVRLLRAGLWLVAVAAPAALAYFLVTTALAPNAPQVSLDKFRDSAIVPQRQVVTLPAGTRVPLAVRLRGDMIDEVELTIPLVLTRPVDIGMRDGRPDGRFRIADGDWKSRRYDFRLRNVHIDAALSPVTGPSASAELRLSGNK